jgi:hyperosmotically inducible protein
MNSRRFVSWGLMAAMIAVFGVIELSGYTFAQSDLKADLEAGSDKAVQGAMVHLLTKQGILMDNNIQVMASRGVVTFTGTVKTIAERKRAEHDAYEVAPGYKIADDLSLEAVTVSDQQIAQDVKNSIRRHTFYTVFDWITLQVSGGVAILGGWVHQPWMKDIFAKQAERTIGVKEVKNEIVALPLSFYDDEVRYRVASLIYNDPTFEDHMYDQDPPIHIIVNGGKVTLEGIVDNDNEKSIAESIVYIRADIGQVENLLVIQKP